MKKNNRTFEQLNVKCTFCETNIYFDEKGNSKGKIGMTKIFLSVFLKYAMDLNKMIQPLFYLFLFGNRFE